MPLSESQKDFIESAVNHLLDFETTSEKELQEAMTSPVEPDHEFFWLRACLLKPTESLRGLETQGKTATVGEVQMYIIELIMHCIEESHPNISIKKEDLTKQLSPNQSKLLFKSKIIVKNTDPWHLPTPEGKIYTQRIRLIEKRNHAQETTFVVMLDVSVTLAAPKIINHSLEIDTLPRSYSNNQAENAFIQASKVKAKTKAIEFAIQSVIDHLAKKHFKNKLSIKINDFSALKLFLDNQFFKLLDENKIFFLDVIELNSTQLKILVHPSMIALIQKNPDTFNLITQLSLAQSQVASHPSFSSMDQKEILKIASTLSPRRAKLLIHPHITRLIQTGKLSIKNILEIPFHSSTLLTSALYVDFFIKKDIPWKDIKKIDPSHIHFYMEKNISYLLTHEIIDFSQMTSAPSFILRLFSTHPALTSFLENKILRWEEDILSLPDSSQTTMLDLFIKACTHRLYAIHMNQPYPLNPSKQRDNFTLLFDGLPNIANSLGISIALFETSLLKKFILIVKALATQQFEMLSRDNSQSIAYYRFLNYSNLKDFAAQPTDMSLIAATLAETAKFIQKINFNLSIQKNLSSANFSYGTSSDVMFAPPATRKKFQENKLLHDDFFKKFLELSDVVSKRNETNNLYLNLS